MKKTHVFCLAIAASAALAASPVLLAQETAAPDNTQNTRAHDSTADKHADSNGSSASQSGTLEKNNSKDGASEVRDANPSTATSSSLNEVSTKEPAAQNADNNGRSTTVRSSEVSDRASSKESKPMSDQDFIVAAAQGGMTEVELGKLAAQKGQSPKVKEFGTRMVTDHSQADGQLKDIAQKKGVTVPDQLDAKHRAMVNHFSSLNGRDFDRAYVHAMVRDHEKDASEFRTESQSGQDPEVKSFAANTLKTIEDHLQHVKTLQSEVK